MTDSITPSQDQNVDILIIGGGLSGCYSLHQLRKINPTPTVKLIEAGSDFGGVWYWNRYPGARVDSKWPEYQFSIPEVWKTWSYEDRFPDHNQLRAYVKHMDSVLDLRRDAIFNTVVDQANWDDTEKRWITSTNNGNVFRSRHLIVCSGSSYKRHFPDFKGLETFRGTLLHSASFPEGGIDMTGKRVGIVGSGATAVQIIQELSKHDCQLTNFIRTPGNPFPLRQRKIQRDEEDRRKSEYEAIFKSQRTTTSGFSDTPDTLAFKEASNEQRDAILQKAWDEGGFAFILSTFPDYLIDKEVNAYFYRFWADRVRARVTDPEKREIIAPVPQQHWFSSKRPPLEQDYYESIDRPNVKLVSLKKSPISEITETGLITEDGTLYELDILILATGFDALNGSQMALGLHDKDGVALRKKWSSGTKTLHGITIPGFPNTFMSYGPQGPAALGNAPPIIEVAVDWIAEAIQKMEDEGIETIEPQADVAEKWGQSIQDTNNMTVLAEEDSWWMGANVPGKFREQLNYLAGLATYSQVINESLDGWKGFDIVKRNSS